MSKVLAFLKQPKVRVAIAAALTVAAAYVASGRLDLTPLLQLLGG
jgi:hypothetical protein